MSIINRIKGWAIICSAARAFGESPKQVRECVCVVIEEAWATKDPKARALQRRLFPRGRPVPEEFAVVISRLGKKK